MAITKKAAKKSVPKVIEEPKQIVLTQDQYDELVSLKWEINSISNQIESISTDEDKNQRQVAFDMGVLHVRTEKLYDDLTKITQDIDPEPLPDWGDDDDDDNN
jgi:predicted CopG family antitoxin